MFSVACQGELVVLCPHVRKVCLGFDVQSVVLSNRAMGEVQNKRNVKTGGTALHAANNYLKLPLPFVSLHGIN